MNRRLKRWERFKVTLVSPTCATSNSFKDEASSYQSLSSRRQTIANKIARAHAREQCAHTSTHHTYTNTHTYTHTYTHRHSHTFNINNNYICIYYGRFDRSFRDRGSPNFCKSKNLILSDESINDTEGYFLFEKDMRCMKQDSLGRLLWQDYTQVTSLLFEAVYLIVWVVDLMAYWMDLKSEVQLASTLGAARDLGYVPSIIEKRPWFHQLMTPLPPIFLTSLRQWLQIWLNLSTGACIEG